MNPLFNTAGYALEDRVLRVLQAEGWIEIPIHDVAELKTPFASSVIVRMTDGRRRTLNLTHLSVDGYRVVITALKEAAKSRRATPRPNS